MIENTTYARRWLMVGVGALALAGVLAVVLVVARTPQLAALTLFKELFGKSLVIHVDLSVLVWFLAAAGMSWNLIEHKAERGWLCLPYMRSSGLWIFLVGTVLMAASLLMGGAALKNNYVPVLTNMGFILSLGLLLAGSVLAAIDVLGRVRLHDFSGEQGALNFGMASGAPMLLAAALCFYLSAEGVKGRVEGEQFYELVFWGGGHALQFLYAQVMMVAWVWLARALELRIPNTLLYCCFALGLLTALTSPLAYLLYDVTSFEYKQFFTEQMKWGLGIAPTLLAVGIVWAWLQSCRRHCEEAVYTSGRLRPERVEHKADEAIQKVVMPHLLRRLVLVFSRPRNKCGVTKWLDCFAFARNDDRALTPALTMSLLLFFFGGAFGLLIEGENVMTPAHYHGSIVGVTLALMGAAYLLLPRFGGKPVAGWRLAFWQPVVYGAGQLLHISGLAYSGGYEVLRKTPGEVTDAARAAMGIMGMGGLLAIIGGIMFVVVVIRGIGNRESRSKQFIPDISILNS